MNYITTTELRTKSPELIRMLKSGKRIKLIHRSHVIGEISPDRDAAKILTAQKIQKLKKLIIKMNLPSLSYTERERQYRSHLVKKYGKGVS